jgi:hypothetical protein
MDVILKRLWKGFFTSIMVLALSLVTAPVVCSAAGDDVPRMTVQELKARMDGGEDVLIIDVRTGSEYAGSKIKIKGALRIPLFQLEESRYKELPQDKEIIAYCT